MRSTGDAFAWRRDVGLLRDDAVDDAGEPEVEQLDTAVVGQDRVGRLDVAVEDAAAMGGGEPAREVERDLEDLSRWQGSLELIERPATHILRHQIGMPRDLGDPIDRDDVGMLEPRDRPRFVEELGARHRIGGALDELHRDRPIEQ